LHPASVSPVVDAGARAAHAKSAAKVAN
jgi:hypothetical protein